MWDFIKDFLCWLFNRPPAPLPPPDRSVKRETQIADELTRIDYRNRRQA